MLNKKTIGDIGEDVACKYLKKLKYKIIERNFRTRTGEIDIIAKEKNTIVFVEVKTRSNNNYGLPIESVNIKKQKHLASAIKYYLHINHIQNISIRFDVVEIYIVNNKYIINHIKNCIL